MATRQIKPVRASEPAAPKKRLGKTTKPLAPERIAAILDALRKAYPHAVCALTHRSAWELTVATILSAQCTDVRVNIVTPVLFKAFPNPKALAAASLPEIEGIIRTTGFFRAKAKNIQGAARVVVNEYGGKVPQTMEELLRLPGVARLRPRIAHMELQGGWVFAAGQGLLSDPLASLHRRSDFGIVRRGAYVSVDTGKYATAPWLARRLAESIG